MKTTLSATMLLAAAAAMLAGCQGLGSQVARQDLRIPRERSPEDYAAGQLSLGREALGLREWGLAVTSFRLVRHMPEHAAEASNGMAIAYANIGRPDLAERLFQQAVALAPGDARYQTNLTRFYATTPALAVKTDRGAELAAQTAGEIPPSLRTIASRQGSATIRIALPASRMVRVSAGEVRLGLPAVQTRPAALAASGGRRANPQFRRAPTLSASSASVVPSRVTVRSAAAYPVRITVGPR